MTICILDTSVFCNLLDVPAFNQDREDTLSKLEDYLEEGYTLLLPLAAIYETGNHIAHVANGRARREAAKRFVGEVAQAIAGQVPWRPTPFPDRRLLTAWLAEFPDCAMRKVGLADLSIIREFERQCKLHRMRRVLVWSYDYHLQGYDRKVGSG
ncbi:hypothetical protein [Candidatus Thiosymbion oneisti]|uniref:hypothetical protein n=1 Tax=Candidatus Thiosymbion oneisti TaxID=589554 RepID=UPI001A9C95C3|nr:hypothetical protein [Candidatus Thiosymbion oneisti]